MSLKLVGPEWTPLVMPNYCPIDAQFAQHQAFFYLLRSSLIRLRYIHDAIDSFNPYPPHSTPLPRQGRGVIWTYCGFIAGLLRVSPIRMYSVPLPVFPTRVNIRFLQRPERSISAILF